jgi:hypothetical protein
MIDPSFWSAPVAHYTPKILRHKARGFVGPCLSGDASSSPPPALSVADSGAPGIFVVLLWGSGAGSSGIRWVNPAIMRRFSRSRSLASFSCRSKDAMRSLISNMSALDSTCTSCSVSVRSSFRYTYTLLSSFVDRY